PFYIYSVECLCRDRSTEVLSADYHSFKICQRLQRKFREIQAICKAMKGTIHISPGVCNHLDLADVKFSSFGVVFMRILPGKKITNDWGRESFISEHAMFDGMPEVDQFFAHRV